MVNELPPPDPTTRAGGAPDASESPDAGSSTELVPVEADPTTPATTVEPAAPRRSGQPPWAIPAAIGAGLVLAFIVGYSLVQGLDGDDEAGPSDAASWNAFAVVDSDTGDVRILDPEGAEIDVIETGIDTPNVRVISNTRLALQGETEVALVDLHDGETETFDKPDDLNVFVTSRGAPIPYLANSNGANALVPIDDDDGEVVDVADEAGWDEPLVVPASLIATPDGEHLLVPDQRTTATAVGDLDDGDVATVDGWVVAADDAAFTVFSRDDDAVTLERFDLDGESQGSVEIAGTPRLVFGGGDSLIVLTDEGGILRADVAGGTVDEIGQLDIDQLVDAAQVPDGATSYALATDDIDDDTALLYVIGPDGSATAGVEVDGDLLDVAAGPDEGCVAITSPESVEVLRLATGESIERVDVERPADLLTSVDACSVIPIVQAQRTILTPDGVVELGEDQQAIAISPDGAWILVYDRPVGEDARRFAVPLDAIDDGEIDPEAMVELPDRSPVVFVQHG